MFLFFFNSKFKAMNLTHLHLLLNHFPIIGTLIGSSIILCGIIKNQQQAKSIGATIFFVMAIIAIPVFLTGEPAEETVEHLQGISKSIIHDHEEAAELALWIMEIAGLFALVSLFFQYKKSSIANNLFIITFVLTLISFAFMARTGYLGGQIRHTELSSTLGSGQNELLNTKTNNDNDD
jgi:uncharacterized membrane protein